MLISYCLSAQKNHAKKWKLAWSEEFNGNSLDTLLWSKVPRGDADWKRHMSDNDELYAVKDGNLMLWGVNNNIDKSDTMPYLTGGVRCVGKHSFGNGRIEIRAKFDCANGFWPAIWMLPDVVPPVWPKGGEIDIMEHLNHDAIVYQTVHSAYTQKVNDVQGHYIVHSATAIINPDDYNVYAMEKYDDSIVFFVNNERIYCYEKQNINGEDQFPFSGFEFYLILSAQLGGSWVGKIDLAQLPVVLCIDWVRFYERKFRY